MLRNRELKRIFFAISAAGILFAAVSFMIDIRAGIVNTVGFIFLYFIFFMFTNRRYRNIRCLSSDINRITNGDFSLDIRDNEEGELSILKNEVYKLTMRLTEQAAVVEKDRQTLSEYMSDISHQLKTPLSSLLVMSELLEKKDLPPQKRDEFLGNIKSILTRMEWLAISLLKMAKLDAHAVTMQSEMAVVEEMVTMAVQLLEPIISTKRQHIEIRGNSRIQVSCDVRWTVEALTNIIKNASEHSPDNGTIRVSWDENPLAVLITVADSGTGINDFDVPNLFRRYYHGRHGSNAGIGLPLALAIMQKQNGDIGVKNNKEAGSVFTLKFHK